MFNASSKMILNSQRITPVTSKFILTPSTRSQIMSMKPNFGFNGLGEFVFKRTYSRDGESWNDVVLRVIEGVMTIRKNHYSKNNLRWRDEDWQTLAKNMAVSMFKMEWLPPGRGLWMMGTDFVYKRGSMALCNCGATDTTNDIVHSVDWAMDALMNGVGVGFNTKWKGVATKPDKSDCETYVIPDSREGWVDSLIKLMISYIDSPMYGKGKYPIFDYSQIRPKGTPIKGFGGVASGSEPLKKLHERVESYLDAYCDGRLKAKSKTYEKIIKEDNKEVWEEKEVQVDKEYTSSRFVADIFNSIGACVVAGNVRRCLPGDALVHTKNGLMPIKDVRPGMHVLTTKGYFSVKNWFEQGKQKTVKIITQDGEFECTFNHKMAVLTDYNDYTWKQADELNPGDRLITTRSIIGGTNTSLPNTSGINTISVPELDYNMAWFFGILQSTGVYNPYTHDMCSLRFNVSEYDIAEKIFGQLQRFNGISKITLRRNELFVGYTVSCELAKFSNYFSEHVPRGANTRIPKWIMQSSPLIRKAYIAGIIDGHDIVRGLKPAKLFSTKHVRYAKDVQALLYSCGIESRYTRENTKWSLENGCEHTYSIRVITQRAQSLITSLPDLVSTPNQSLYQVHDVNSFPEEFETSEIVRTRYGLDAVDRLTIDEYDIEHGISDITPVSVISVVDANNEVETYDIEVDTHHEFFCDGYLTHNSAEIALGEVGDETFMDLKNYTKNPERSEIGWMSNNSVVLGEEGDFEDFSFIPKMAERIRDNGEPGIINLYNMQRYGRYGKDMPDKANLVNPCSEIQLCSFELCNLSEVFPMRCGSSDAYYKALEYATFYSSTVSLLPTHRPETNAIIAKNRRIGVSISGIAQWAETRSESEWGDMNYTRMTTFLRQGYKVVRSKNSELAESAGVPESIRVTTVKPSGSISLLAGATPGMHYPVSRHAIRRVRVADNSPLVDVLKSAGVHCEKDSYSDNTLVFSFAIDHGDVRPCDKVSPWEQFSLNALLQRCWSDNMVSCTIYFDKEKDKNDIEKLLAMFIPVLKSVSMLPHSGHSYTQAPYEPIDKTAYEKLKDSYTQPVYTTVKNNVPQGEKFCTNDTCTL